MVRRELYLILLIYECHIQGDLAQRVLATDNGAYSALLRLLGKPGADLQCKVLTFVCLMSDRLDLNFYHDSGAGDPE